MRIEFIFRISRICCTYHSYPLTQRFSFGYVDRDVKPFSIGILISRMWIWFGSTLCHTLFLSIELSSHSKRIYVFRKSLLNIFFWTFEFSNLRICTPKHDLPRFLRVLSSPFSFFVGGYITERINYIPEHKRTFTLWVSEKESRYSRASRSNTSHASRSNMI